MGGGKPTVLRGIPGSSRGAAGDEDRLDGDLGRQGLVGAVDEGVEPLEGDAAHLEEVLVDAGQGADAVVAEGGVVDADDLDLFGDGDSAPEEHVDGAGGLFVGVGDDADRWASAFASFIPAKQAGFDIGFSHLSQPLPEAELYLLPGLAGPSGLTVQRQDELLARVRDGASLYVSFADGLFQPFEPTFGLDVQYRQQPMDNVPVTFPALPGEPVLTGNSEFHLYTKPTTADVLGATPDGNPAFACNRIGQGKVYYLSFPVESMLSRTPGAFHGPGAQPYYRIYQHIAADVIARRAVRVDHPTVSVTEHPLDDGRALAVVINHGPDAASVPLDLTAPWRVAASWYGPSPASGTIDLPGNDAAVLLLTSGGMDGQL